MDPGPKLTIGLPPLAWRGMLLVAVVVMAGLLAVADRYGFHRDELYFLEAGRHQAFGYVDQPPLVPTLARVQSALFGMSPRALRVVPALVTGLTAVLAGALAREFGGDARAQTWSSRSRPQDGGISWCRAGYLPAGCSPS